MKAPLNNSKKTQPSYLKAHGNAYSNGSVDANQDGIHFTASNKSETKNILAIKNTPKESPRLMTEVCSDTYLNASLTLQLYQNNAHDIDQKNVRNNLSPHKGYQLKTTIAKPTHVSIIGGGIASACLAYQLTKQGVETTLYCKDDDVAQGASSNAIGALYPLIHQKRDDISLFYQQALQHAKTLYNEVHTQGFHFKHDWCGLLEVSYKHSLEVRQLAIAQKDFWPKTLIQSVTQKQASVIAGINLTHGGLFIPEAGWIAPQDLVKALFNASKATGLLHIKPNTHIVRLSKIEKNKTKSKQKNTAASSAWKMHTSTQSFKADILVVCAGADSITLDVVNALPLNPTRGQITSMKTNDRIGDLSTVICHKGYLTP